MKEDAFAGGDGEVGNAKDLAPWAIPEHEVLDGDRRGAIAHFLAGGAYGLLSIPSIS